MRRLPFVVGLLAVLGVGGNLVLTATFTWAATYRTRTGADDAKRDLVNGRAVFSPGGRGTRHARPGQQEATRLGGGLALVSGVGTFQAPNISPDPIAGIGDWNTKQPTQSLVKMRPLASNVAKSPSSALAQSADALSHASVVYTVATKPLFLDRASVGSADSGDGRILPAAKLTVLARDGDWLRVRIDGWQLQGSEAAFEALEGQRIVLAILGSAAIAEVERHPGVVDVATNATWFQGALTAWVSNDGLTTDLDKIWKYDSVLYATSCGTCHAPRPVDGLTSDRWLTDLKRMKRFTGLQGDQYLLLEAYLQYHSKDVGPLIAAGKP